MTLQPMMSHPMWVRGLKRVHYGAEVSNSLVAPYVGAWIETVLFLVILVLRSVAPYVGAWIETFGGLLTTEHPPSRTLCGCVD